MRHMLLDMVLGLPGVMRLIDGMGALDNDSDCLMSVYVFRAMISGQSVRFDCSSLDTIDLD
jgi:hypothetical protein